MLALAYVCFIVAEIIIGAFAVMDFVNDNNKGALKKGVVMLIIGIIWVIIKYV